METPPEIPRSAPATVLCDNQTLCHCTENVIILQNTIVVFLNSCGLGIVFAFRR